MENEDIKRGTREVRLMREGVCLSSLLRCVVAGVGLLHVLGDVVEFFLLDFVGLKSVDPGVVDSLVGLHKGSGRDET